MEQSDEPMFQIAKEAFHLELLSVGWVATEATLTAVAATVVGSISLSAFSIESGIELISGMVLVIRMWVQLHVESKDAIVKIERVASIIIGFCLFLLAAYIAVKSGQSFARHSPLSSSHMGLIVAGFSSVVTPWFAIRKRQYGQKLGSRALLGDAACSWVCAYMAWTLFLGLLCQLAFGWWWADPVAAVGILLFILHEAFEAFSVDNHAMAHLR